jgi:hypothetical protein
MIFAELLLVSHLPGLYNEDARWIVHYSLRSCRHSASCSRQRYRPGDGSVTEAGVRSASSRFALYIDDDGVLLHLLYSWSWDAVPLECCGHPSLPSQPVAVDVEIFAPRPHSCGRSEWKGR